MVTMARCALLSFLIVFTACVDSPSEPQLATFPALLSDLGLARIGTYGYEPAWELWTNGAGKDRSVRLPEGGVIGTENRQDWVFPEGTLFTKTFTYRTADSPDIPLPLETRVILRMDGRWETAVYRWREDRTDADLLPGYAWVFPLGDGTANVGVGVPRGRGRGCSRRGRGLRGGEVGRLAEVEPPPRLAPDS